MPQVTQFDLIIFFDPRPQNDASTSAPRSKPTIQSLGSCSKFKEQETPLVLISPVLVLYAK